MFNWLYKKSSLYKQQQEENVVLRKSMQQIIKDAKDELKWTKKFNVFADNINHILTNRTNGTAIYFLPEITFILVTTQIMQHTVVFSVYAPFDAVTGIANAYTYLDGAGNMIIEEFWVRDDLQRKGLGSSLLEEIIFRAKQLQQATLVVNTDIETGNHDQFFTDFYKKFGFVQQEQNEQKGSILAMQLAAVKPI